MGHLMSTLILASTSVYRRALLERLRIPFQCLAPHTDESPLAHETPSALAIRLAQAKAQAIANMHPQAWVIGSDQVVDCQGQLLGKPGNHERAVAQLQSMRGQVVKFHTAVCVMAPDFCEVRNVITEVLFKNLSDATIESYLRAEEPYDCAGSAKSEGLGISLLEYIRSDDPTALVGLPLITTLQLLKQSGFSLPLQ